ncbi:hypothetical protein HCH15_01220 [Corynebacterium testudinoris]|uniref:hypothetical protein n=1 Tax=Corynebacterium testudinoris TaxID=136857 RepID=UPI001C8BA2A6|nr:hypothetical protein [Corynebacterium testudinoris]MBX8994804.1 hypothetical protein [Corynebacterium testudinoris]
MGRHSNGQPNNRLSGGLIAAAIVAVLAIIFLVVWFIARDNNEGEKFAASAECIDGDLILPIAAAGTTAEDLVNKYNESNPVVRDYCVKAQIVDSVDSAALYLAPDSPRTVQALGTRTVSSTSPVAVDASQLWNADGGDLSNIDPATITYPVATDPDAAVAVATALDPERAAELIARDRNATIADASGVIAVGPADDIDRSAGSLIDVAGAEVIHVAHVLNPAGSVTEEQTRAAADFAEMSSIQSQVPANLPDRKAAWAVVGTDTPASSTAPATSPSASAPSDTLILLDTSSAAGATFFGETTAALSATALDLGADGHQVSVWNYSSPLNPGVTKGWRSNVNFTDSGEPGANALLRFGYGGVPQTRSSLVAAAGAASDHARTSGESTRILLVTTGTAQDMDDADFTQAFYGAVAGADVKVDVIHLGSDPSDQAVAGVATSTTTVTSPDQLDSAIRKAVGL